MQSKTIDAHLLSACVLVRTNFMMKLSQYFDSLQLYIDYTLKKIIMFAILVL